MHRWLVVMLCAALALGRDRPQRGGVAHEFMKNYRSRNELLLSSAPNLFEGAPWSECGKRAAPGSTGIVYAYHCISHHGCKGAGEFARLLRDIQEESGIHNVTLFCNLPDKLDLDLPTGVQVLDFEGLPDLPSGLWKKPKPWAICNSPYERTLYLDTDTEVFRELRRMFRFLDTYDALLVPNHLESNGPYDYWNSGVVALDLSRASVRFLVHAWMHNKHTAHSSLDQTALKRALNLLGGAVRVGVLPQNFNFRPHQPILTQGPIYVKHLRSVPTTDEMRESRRKRYRLFDKGQVVWGRDPVEEAVDGEQQPTRAVDRRAARKAKVRETILASREARKRRHRHDKQ